MLNEIHFADTIMVHFLYLTKCSMEVIIIDKLIGKKNAEITIFSESNSIPIIIKAGNKNQIIAETIKYGFLFFSLL